MIALAIVFLTAVSGAQAASPINNEQDLATEVAQVVIEPPVVEPTAEKRGEVLEWKDNPNECDTNTQYILADTFECRDKPVANKVVASVQHPIGCENYRELVSQYDWNVSVMLQIMKAESSCNPSSVGDNYPIRGLLAPSCGLFQIRTLSSRPSCEALKDPATNIAWAYRIYQGQGYPAWTVCRTKVACY